MLHHNQVTDAAAMDTAARSSATHLVVFQHGLLGSEADFANVVTLFQTHLGSENVYAHLAQCNLTTLTNVFATCDGIDHGAERLACEIVRVAADMPQLNKFSIVGHSMGGLYARYCIGILYARGFFHHIEPVNFVTLATPHLGNRRPQRGSVNLIYNAIAPKLFDRTGQQFALTDTASDETIALSRRVENKYPYRPSFAAFQELDGVLFVDLSMKDAFQPHRCELRDRVLSIYAVDVDAPETNCLKSMDMTSAEVTLRIPDKAFDNWDIVIRPSDDTKECTLRLPHDDLTSHWQWISAVSNASYDIHCRSDATKRSPSFSSPSLLSCLTRGQFMQALQLFPVRTLYATVFNDHTVPYSCAAIRAFNPYRQNGNKALQTSPYYDHILERSLPQAPLLRNTLPPHAKASTPRKTSANYERTKELASQSVPSNQADGSSTNETQEISQPSLLSSLFSNGSDTSRPPPFTNGDVLLDRIDNAFSTDDERDTLRGMLIALQSVGWRRLDVCLESLLAHEMIIAKRANITNAPCEGGLDIIHHILDTFVL